MEHTKCCNNELNPHSGMKCEPRLFHERHKLKNSPINKSKPEQEQVWKQKKYVVFDNFRTVFAVLWDVM
jgi:hypothetical protein